MSPDLRIQFVEAPALVRLHDRTDRRRKPPSRQESSGEQETHPADGGEEPSVAEAAAVETVSERPPAAAPIPAVGDAPTPHWAVAQGRFEELLKRIENEIGQLGQQMEKELRALEPQIVRLALAVARKVLGRAAELGQVDLESLVREGLSTVCKGIREHKEIRVRVASEYKGVIEEVLGDGAQVGRRVRLEVDETVPSPGCEIDCDMRQVSINLQKELDRIGDALLGGEQNDG